MSEFEDAMQRLERAVARLEVMPEPPRPDPQVEADRQAEAERVRAVAAAALARIDVALDRIGLLLGPSP